MRLHVPLIACTHWVPANGYNQSQPAIKNDKIVKLKFWCVSKGGTTLYDPINPYSGENVKKNWPLL